MLTKKHRKQLEELTDKSMHTFALCLVSFLFWRFVSKQYADEDICFDETSACEFDKHFHGETIYFEDFFGDDSEEEQLYDELTNIHEAGDPAIIDLLHSLPHTLLEMGFVEIAARTAEMNRWIDERLSQG